MTNIDLLAKLRERKKSICSISSPKKSVKFETINECTKPYQESFIIDDSFNNERPRSSMIMLKKKKIKKSDTIDIKEVTQVDATVYLPEEGKNSHSVTSNKKINNEIRVKNQKLKIVNNRVKHSLIEWKNVKLSKVFRSGNFDLPLYTLSK